MGNINQLVTTFLAAGGLGYINYWILERLDVTDSSNGENSKNASFLLFSIPDFFVFLLLRFILKKSFHCLLKVKIGSDLVDFIAIFLTVIIIFESTAKFGKKFVEFIYARIRKYTKDNKGNNDTGVFPGSPWTALDKTGESLVYIYSFDKKPIIFGYGESYSEDIDNNYSLNIQPDVSLGKHLDFDDIFRIACYEDGSPALNIDCERSQIHVNLKQQFIMFIFKVKK